MIAQAGFLVVVSDVKPNRNKVALRDERDRAGLCVKCGQIPKKTKGKRKLGNCRQCYDEYYNTLTKLADLNARAAYYVECVRECLIMPNRQGKRGRGLNDFERIAERIKS